MASKREDFENRVSRFHDRFFFFANCLCQEEAQTILQKAYLKAFLNFNPAISDAVFKKRIYKMIVALWRSGRKLNMEEEMQKSASWHPASKFSGELVDAINMLPWAQRVLIFLCDVEGYSYRDTASILSISPETLNAGLSSARKNLRELLKE